LAAARLLHRPKTASSKSEFPKRRKTVLAYWQRAKLMADKFVLLLDFSSGIIEPLPLSPDGLTNDRIVIAIDEINECVWLWQGADTSLIERRAAQRKAQSLVSAGYQFGPLRIGRALARLQVVDGQVLDDSETKQSYERLIQTLRRKFSISDGVLGRFGDTAPSHPSTSTPSPPAKQPSREAPPVTAPSVGPRPQLKVAATEPARPVTKAPAAAKPQAKEAVAEPVRSVKPAPSSEADDLAVVRVGILIACILEYFPLCYVSSAKGLAGTRYRIEDPDGVICELDVDQGSVHFVKRYDFHGKRTEILSRLRERLDAASL
jgi:hypothetical protein